nr:phosphate ABC transporter, permease protein PstA [Bacillota bacterium]
MRAPGGPGMRRRRRAAAVALQALALGAVVVGLGVLVVLLFDVLRDGAGTLTWTFLDSFPSRRWQQAGFKAAIFGSVYLLVLVAVISFPLGVGAAVYLEEYARRSAMTRFVEINIANLAAVPSIVYGLLGLGVFVRTLGLGRSLLAGALTMSLLILPVIITAAREAIRAVPASIREGAYALGASRWQVVRHHVLPMALPGILTGTILALSRAIGETAPLIAIGALTYVAFVPESVFDPFTAMPIQIYNWVSRPQQGFHAIAASGILVLLVVMLGFNALAIVLRARMQRRSQW